MVLLYLFLFIFGSMLGWVLEVFFRRITVKKWVNPGFMKGPWLPLYGFGVIAMYSMCHLCVALFPDTMHFYNPLGNLFERNYTSGAVVSDLFPISLMWASMVLLEFVAGIIFIKGFHVKLWDYSNIKGNIMGIICPLFNLIWLMIAIIFYYGINPFLYVVNTHVYNFMFNNASGEVANFVFLFIIGILYGFMIYDFVTSVGLFNAVSKFARESGIVDRYEATLEKWNEIIREGKRKIISDKKETEKKRSNKAIIKEKLQELIYIDPEKQKQIAKNYDEKGRPVKMDEE